MGKRKRGREDRSTDVAPPINNPFAALTGLREALPEGDPAPEPEHTAAPEASEGEALASSRKLVVRREKKGRAGKTVTRIEGLPSAELDAIAKRMKTALGCGAMVEGEALLLQGAHVERAKAWLEAHVVARGAAAGRRSTD